MAGSVLVDHTTNSPELVRETHRTLERAGVAMLDAPVSGGAEGARTRDLTMLVGGDGHTVERCRPVLDAIAKTVMHVGDIGAGCVCKIAHNCATFSLDMATAECLTMGVRAGVDPAVLIEVFQKCAIGRNFNLHTRLPGHAVQRRLRAALRAEDGVEGHAAGHRPCRTLWCPDESDRGLPG